MTIRRRTRDILGLVGWLLPCYAAAAVGALASVEAGAFYAELARPDWAPPGALFGPVWTALYTLMGIAAWLAWRAGRPRARRAALLLFAAQLAANALWSWLFFGWRLGGAALLDVVLLWLLVLATLIAFWRIRPAAGALLLPYLCWVGFAAALNLAVWRLNPALLG